MFISNMKSNFNCVNDTEMGRSQKKWTRIWFSRRRRQRWVILDTNLLQHIQTLFSCLLPFWSATVQIYSLATVSYIDAGLWYVSDGARQVAPSAFSMISIKKWNSLLIQYLTYSDRHQPHYKDWKHKIKLLSFLVIILLLYVVQLRRMQEMIAKMQAQMQKQGDGDGDGPHVWR